ncbi:MAG: SLC13 family permease [Bacteroidota bacterium]|nr:SLC13 family permease [Bacteroidota bacterium]
MLFVLVLLLAVMILFAIHWLSPDIIVLLALCLLVFSGAINSNEAFQGFGNDFIIMLITIFIIGGVLKHNGIIEYLLQKVDKLPKLNLSWLIITTMIVTAALSAFMNNTAVVSVFIAPLIGLSNKFNVSPSKLLMPMAFASLMGGTCTLIGTSTNIAGSNFLAQKGIEPISMFELLPLGLPIILFGTLFMATIGKKLLPAFEVEKIQTDKFLRKYVSEAIVNSNSPSIGKVFLKFEKSYPQIKFAELIRGGELLVPTDTTYIEQGDIMILKAEKDSLLLFLQTENLSILQNANAKFNLNQEMEMVELLVLPNSAYIGKSVHRSLLQEQRSISVVAIHRQSENLKGNLDDVELKSGDMLVVLTTHEEVVKIQQNANFIIVSQHDKSKNINLRKGFGILLLFGCAILLGSLKIIPISIAFMLTALVAYLIKAIPPDALMRSVDWRMIILIGGMSAFGVALTNTGGDIFIAEKITHLLSPLGNYGLMAGFMLITVLLTQPMSNAASVLVVLPIALQSAVEMGVEPRPLAIAVIVSASISMIAPFEPASLLVFAPGRYKILDFIKVGGILTIGALLIILFTVPLIWKL